MTLPPLLPASATCAAHGHCPKHCPAGRSSPAGGRWNFARGPVLLTSCYNTNTGVHIVKHIVRTSNTLQFARPPPVPPPVSLPPSVLALRRVCQDAFSMCVQHWWVVPCLQIVVPTDLQGVPGNDESPVFAGQPHLSKLHLRRMKHVGKTVHRCASNALLPQQHQPLLGLLGPQSTFECHRQSCPWDQTTSAFQPQSLPHGTNNTQETIVVQNSSAKQ